MMRRIRRIVAVLMLLTAAALSGGCLAAAAGAGAGAGVAYATGDSEGIVKADPEVVLEAAHGVIEEMDMFVTSETLEGEEPQIYARTASDRRVKITVRRLAAGRTKLWVRVGVFRDKDVSNVVYRRIANRAEEEGG